MLFSCRKNNTPDNTISPSEIDKTPSYVGDFKTGEHETSGLAIVSTDLTKLYFGHFKTDNGPRLNIYLTADLSDVEADFIDLGKIKGVEGDYVYDIPANTDLSKYKYVSIWCVRFHVGFGQSTLIEQ